MCLCFFPGTGHSPHQHTNSQAMDRSSNATSSRSKSYLSNNPYGSLERKALKQRRSANRAINDTPTMPNPNSMYNPYTQNQRMDYNNYATMDSYNRYHPADSYRQSPNTSRTEDQPPPIPAARVPKPHHAQQAPQPAYRPRANHQREYAHNVHQASRRMYDSSQPFQMLENPYNTHRRNMDQLSQNFSDAHIAPIKIDTHPHMPSAPHRRASGDRQYLTDSSSDLNSPQAQENAFNFFNTLNSYVHSSVVNNNNPYKQAGPVSADLGRHRSSYGQEETKPYEMKDFYQYSERLRKARGMNHPNSRSQDHPPPLPAARSSGSRTPSSPGVSLEGSRSGSPYTTGPPPPAGKQS